MRDKQDHAKRFQIYKTEEGRFRIRALSDMRSDGHLRIAELIHNSPEEIIAEMRERGIELEDEPVLPVTTVSEDEAKRIREAEDAALAKEQKETARVVGTVSSRKKLG